MIPGLTRRLSSSPLMQLRGLSKYICKVYVCTLHFKDICTISAYPYTFKKVFFAVTPPLRHPPQTKYEGSKVCVSMLTGIVSIEKDKMESRCI